MMLARRKTNVFLVGFLFMGEGVWILVNFILRKLFRLYQVLVTSTGKTSLIEEYHRVLDQNEKRDYMLLKRVLTGPGS